MSAAFAPRDSMLVDEFDEPGDMTRSTTLMDASFTESWPQTRVGDRPPRARQATRGFDYSDTEFNRKYPPDTYGEEAADNARVWQVYFDESSEHDRLLLDGWNKTLDILLIFAGLFSAVSTTFIIESYKGLQQDYQAYTANLLFVVLSNRNDSESVFAPSAEPLPHPDQFTISDMSRWINGLWFTSLVLSLSVALLSILAKQWLDEYISRSNAPFQSARYWARRRAMYFGGIVNWHLPAFISTLPVLLHMSLFFFLAGLVLFLVMLDTAIAYSTLGIATALGIFYVTTLLLPFWRVDCPTRTPLVGQLPRLWDRIIRFWRWACLAGIGFIMRLSKHNRISERLSTFRGRLSDVMDRLSASRKMFRMDDRERHTVSVREADLDASAVQWLLTSSAAQEVVAVAVQAIGALPPRSAALSALRTEETQQLVKDHINANVHVAKQRSASSLRFRSERDQLKYSRYLRTWLALNADRPIFASEIHLIAYLTRHSTPATSDLGLLQFILRWSQDHQNIMFMDLLKTSSKSGHSFTYLPSTVIQGMTIIVRTSTTFDRRTQALSALLHLFHAGRLAEASENELLLAFEPIRELLSHLNIYVHASVDSATTTYTRIVSAYIKLWSSVINQRVRLNLDTKDVSVAAQDLGHLVVRLETPSDTKSIHSATQSTEDLNAFVTFVASQTFTTHSWEVQTLDAMSQLIKRASSGLAPADVARSLAHLALSFIPHLKEDHSKKEEREAIDHTLQAFADDIALIFSFAAYPSQEDKERLTMLGHEDPKHPTIPPSAQPNSNLRHIDLASHRPTHLHGTMLHFLHRHGERESAWKALHSAGWPAGSQLVVADALAANLCVIHRRGIDVSDLIDEFFSINFVTQELIQMAYRLYTLDDYYSFSMPSLESPQEAEYVSLELVESPPVSLVTSVVSRRRPMTEIERLAQHCGELRRDWWRSTCERILDTLSENTNFRDFIIQLRELGEEECITCKRGSVGTYVL